jgi:long-chain acyl-CoA synthetase
VQAVVVGDDRKFVSALVAPNTQTLRAALAERGEAPAGDEELLRSAAARELVLASLQEATEELSPHERPKKVALLPRELSLGHGELTPTLKYKRRAILQNWSELVDELYAEPAKTGEEIA